MLTRADFLSLLALAGIPRLPRHPDHMGEAISDREDDGLIRLDLWRSQLRARLAEPLATARSVALQDGERRYSIRLPALSGRTDRAVLMPRPSATRFTVEALDPAGNSLARRSCVRWFEPVPGIPDIPDSKAGFDLIDIDGLNPDLPYRRRPQNAVSLQAGDPAATGLSLLFVFERGWRYSIIAPSNLLPVPEDAVELRFWLLTDGLASDELRAWYRDGSGQTFQTNLGDARYFGWREFALPLDGRSNDRWGGKNDGNVHGRLNIPAILLTDSVLHQAHAVRMIVAQPYFALRSPDLPPVATPIPRPASRMIEDDYPLLPGKRA